MELMYPIVIVISLIIALLICFKDFNKNKKYTDGKKVANTKYIKETEYYKAKVKRYKFLSNCIKVLSVFCIFLSSLLVARVITIQSKSDEKFNRDIIIGLDVSTSQSEVNVELIKKFKDIIPSIEGDRIGIVVFNTAPVVYCPLTDDYEYINKCLDEIEKQMEISIQHDGFPPDTYEEDGEEMPTIWVGGVGADSEYRGSSLVGDGLARNTIFIS